MRPQIISLLLLTMLGTCQADEPRQFPLNPPNPAAFAQAVNDYVSLGEKRAVHLLSKRIRDDGFSASLLCLVLFDPKPGHEMRAPMWGSFCQIPYLSMPDDRWPLLPLALSGKTYFVLDQTRLLTGVPEDPQDYISFCRANGVFRQKPVSVPTHTEAWHDAQALRRSPAWKALKWKHHDQGTTYDMDEQTVWDRVKAQADAVK